MAMEKGKGMKVVISGFSGVGKGTVISRLMERYPGEFYFSVSATTRDPRPGEEHGREYYFLSDEEFRKLIDTDGLMEYARYQDHYYGTPADPVLREQQDGRNVILDIEVEGAFQVKEKYPDTLLLYLVPPDAGTLKQRLTGRKTETEGQIRGRLRRAAEEAEIASRYEGLLINDRLEDCVEQLHACITDPALVPDTYAANLPLVRKLAGELKEMSEN